MPEEPIRQIVPGEWYFGVHCVVCNNSIIVAPDPSRGVTKIMPGSLGGVMVVCPNCTHSHVYKAGELGHFESRKTE